MPCHDQSVAPVLSVSDVKSRIVRAKKPNGLVPGDLPKKVIQTCAGTLALPVSMIYNRITECAVFPPQWKIEQQIALPKVSPPETEDELRNIVKTPFLSKVYESFVGGWLLPIIKPYLDTGQCGLKGFSITHYLMKLLHFHTVQEAAPCCLGSSYRPQQGLQQSEPYSGHTGPV